MHFPPRNCSSDRSLDLDALRGIAIVAMLLFHFCFDLNHFGFIQIDIYNKQGDAWKYFRFAIVTIFLFCVGISLYLANRNGIRKEKVLKRTVMLLSSALAITVVTYFIFPKSWIYFGVIHFIAVASLIGLPFVRLPRTAALLGVIIIGLYATQTLDGRIMFAPISHWIPSRTEDLVPLVPWMGPVLLGITAGHYGLYRLGLPDMAPVRFLARLGRHSLLIYLAHQPLLFGGVMLARQLL